MSFIYTQSNLKDGMNRGIQGKVGMLSDFQETLNEAVRIVLSEVRLRSTRRSAALVPNLVTGDMEYVAPSDLEGSAIVDIPAQAKRYDGEFTLVPVEQFIRNSRAGDIAIKDANGIRTLLINSATTDSELVIATLANYNNGGTDIWTAFGVATNVAQNVDDYVKGSGSVSYDLSASSGTTAGIVNTGLRSFDLSKYIGYAASIFVYARITSVTNMSNFKLRLGSSASAYYEFTVTVRNDGNAFANGWNLLRFDCTSYTTTGSPTNTALTYAALYMTKTTGKISETGYLFNYMVAKKGKYANVDYYTKYGWQSSAGAYKENSTTTDDLLVADTDEYDLIVQKARVIASEELGILGGGIIRGKYVPGPAIMKYNDLMANYKLKNPSEDKVMVSTYHDYSNDDGSSNTLDSRSQ